MINSKIIVFLLLLIILITGCLTTRSYFPYLENAYDENIIIKVTFKDGDIITEHSTPKGGLVMGEEGRVFDTIEIFDNNDNLLTSYLKDYLDNLRKECGGKEEIYIIYENGIVLISENCPVDGDIKEYVRSLKENK